MNEKEAMNKLISIARHDKEYQSRTTTGYPLSQIVNTVLNYITTLEQQLAEAKKDYSVISNMLTELSSRFNHLKEENVQLQKQLAEVKEELAKALRNERWD